MYMIQYYFTEVIFLLHLMSSLATVTFKRGLLQTILFPFKQQQFAASCKFERLLVSGKNLVQ